jgi:hypothetical protein
VAQKKERRLRRSLQELTVFGNRVDSSRINTLVEGTMRKLALVPGGAKLNTPRHWLQARNTELKDAIRALELKQLVSAHWMDLLLLLLDKERAIARGTPEPIITKTPPACLPPPPSPVMKNQTVEKHHEDAMIKLEMEHGARWTELLRASERGHKEAMQTQERIFITAIGEVDYDSASSAKDRRVQ